MLLSSFLLLSSLSLSSYTTVTKKISYSTIRQRNNKLFMTILLPKQYRTTNHLLRTITTSFLSLSPHRRTFISNNQIKSIMDDNNNNKIIIDNHNNISNNNNNNDNIDINNGKDEKKHDNNNNNYYYYNNNNNNNNRQNKLLSNIKSRFVYGKDDALFHYIEQQHSNKNWGDMLDSGTGLHSIRWLSSLLLSSNNTVTSLTAITADKSMQINVQNELNDLLQYISTTTSSTTTNNVILENKIQVFIGNWFPSSSSLSSSSTSATSGSSENIESMIATKGHTFMDDNNTNNIKQHKQQKLSLYEQLKDQYYDTIIADYLIGSIDGFSPYYQSDMIYKLISYLKPTSNSRLYIVSLQPIPDHTNDPITNIICQICKTRDACILLAGSRCYREYPIEWMIKQLNIISNQYKNDDNYLCNINMISIKRFPIYYTYETILKQINVGRSKLLYIKNISLQLSMKQVLDDYDEQCKKIFYHNKTTTTTTTQTSTTSSSSSLETPSPRHIQFGFDYVIVVEKNKKENI